MSEPKQHDPLCSTLENEGLNVVYFGPVGGSDRIECMSCYYIAKVRADERNRVFTHLDALADRDHTEGCPSLTCTGCADQ